jgi:hypothetical protein
MNAGVIFLLSLVSALSSSALILVYAIRVILRIIALRQAVAFFQAPGTSGDVVKLARNMFQFLTRGKA